MIETAQEIGARFEQEDRFVALGGGAVVLAVIDGHYTAHCADTVKELFSSYTWKPETILENFAACAKETKYCDSGAAASLCLIEDGTVHTAILGDCPVFLETEEEMITFPVHNIASFRDDDEFIKKGGGRIEERYHFYRSLGIQMTRCFGDYEIPTVQKVPHIYRTEGVKRVIICSDGWTGTPERAKSLKTANEFIEDQRERGMRDNTTIVLWTA